MKRRDFLSLVGAGSLAASGVLPLRAGSTRSARVVIVGGGVGGATLAKYLRLFDPGLKVTLVERNPVYIRPYGSTEVLTGHITLQDLEVTYEALRERYGVEVVLEAAVGVDPERRLLRTAHRRELPYDRLVVSPGIQLNYGAYEGYSATVAESRIPCGWIPGPQTGLLARQLQAMREGGTFLLVAPPNPYRCPPGPYERVALVTEWLSRHNPKAKVILADPKDAFVTDETMLLGWNRLYGFNLPADYEAKIAPKVEVRRHATPGPITWIRARDGGKVTRVDASSLRIHTEGEVIKADVVNIIPPMKAGQLAFDLGLTDASGWCPVVRKTFQSTLHPHIHVIGDASIADAMPKSGFSANSQAKTTARAIVEELAGRPAPEPIWENTCYALAGMKYGLFVADVFRLVDGKIARVNTADRYLPLDASPAQIRLGARYQQAWLRTFTQDVFA